ncbi:unnamed protein product [Allacma fusca]|uniref:Uncharacterized protein n=1 Tax=Allacma fusca TaxID=39272 RepID=A0A8J2K8S3_9HEXA|nr:unnamed protein product [Allacma fusca]
MPECKTRYCLLRNRARIPSGPIVTFVYILTFRVLRTLSTLYPLTRQSEGSYLYVTFPLTRNTYFLALQRASDFLLCRQGPVKKQI